MHAGKFGIGKTHLSRDFDYFMAEQDINSLSGKLLIAMPQMGDLRFEKSVIYICAHSSDGAMGFIINRTMQVPTVSDFLRQLEVINEDERILVPENLANQALHVGGPVEPGRGFVLHTPEYGSETTLDVTDRIRLTATLEILRKIATGKGPEKCILALGYSGWASGQLEEEISSNGWLTCDADEQILFDEKHDNKYNRALETLGVNPLLLSSDAGHA